MYVRNEVFIFDHFELLILFLLPYLLLAKKSRYWNTGGNALDVETAGYALMTQVLLGRTAYAGPIVTYMTSQRQGGVGFVSTQVCLTK